MHESVAFGKQHLPIDTDTPVCPDCQKSRSTICAICKNFVCHKHQRKVQGYLPQASVILCVECADAFLHYCREFVSPRYAIG